MRIAALYDIHGNLPALEAVLVDVRRHGAELVLVGGDVVPGPMPTETFDCLTGLDIPVRFIRGNGDRVVAAQHRGADPAEVPAPYRAGIRWNADRLRPGDASTIESWSATLTLATDMGDVLFCHATPRNDIDIFTRETPEERIADAFSDAGPGTVVCGHTHMQFDRRITRHRVINAGSVGMPFGEPGAYWLLIDREFHLQRTAYDFADAARRVRATEYPDAEQFARNNVLQPPAEAAMLAAFAR